MAGKQLKGRVRPVSPASEPARKESMPPIVKFLLSMAALAVFVVASPFLGEAGVRAYDKAFDPYTRPGVLSAEGQSAKFGANRRLFRENRFSFVSPEIQMELTGLSEDGVIHAPTPIRGNVSVYLLPSPTNAVPGKDPPAESERLAYWAFRLEPLRTRPSSEAHPQLVVAPTALDVQEDGPRVEEPPATYDVLCALAPLSAADRATAAAFPGRIFEAGTPLEFDVEILTDLPASNHLVFAYSRPTRSLLRGTSLEPVYDRIAAKVSRGAKKGGAK